MTDNPTNIRNISPAHLRAIGLVAVQWSELETSIIRFICVFSSQGFTLETYKQLRGITAHMNFPQKLDALCTVVGLACKVEEEQHHKALLKFAENLKKDLSGKRNSIVHQDWRPAEAMPDYIKGTSYKARGTFKFDTVEMSATDIVAVAEEIAAANNRLGELTEPIFERLVHETSFRSGGHAP
jgi:hypothetical protein